MIRNVLIVATLLFSTSCKEQQPRSDNPVREAFVWHSLARAGTTASIKSHYLHADKQTGSRQRLSDDAMASLQELLRTARWKRHSQRKISQVVLSLEICRDSGCTLMILTPGSLIDLFASREWYLTTEQHGLFVLLSR
jgi:hypothetical protein